MIFRPTPLAGAFVVELERRTDDRGFFARAWCEEEASEHGIDVRWVQCNVSLNHRVGTLRGMHYQYPDWEAKLVRVTRGAIFDAIVDLRQDSSSYLQSFHVELDAENRHMLYVPRGFAHGFVTLQPETEIFYQMSTPYRAGQDRGFRFDDPRFAIPWPGRNWILSERDRNLPHYAA
jgi:dTDP-4-dehydrorhamnose 3,5-epimerase